MRSDDERKIDRERKRWERANNTPYAQRVRESKRSERAKTRRRELRQRAESRAKEAAYIREYRKREHARFKNRARGAVGHAIKRGTLKRPEACQLCGAPDLKLRDGRTSLRADHYEGYDKILVVRFVCLKCDGEQERKRENTTLGRRLAR